MTPTMIKKSIFIVSAIAITGIAFLALQFSDVRAAKKNGEKFGDWVVTCEESKNNDDSKKQICFLTQQVSIEKDDKQQVIAVFQVGYIGEKKELSLIELLPLGVMLKPGTSVISAKNLIMPGQYTTCLNSGCNAVAPISDADLKTLLSNTENVVAFISLEGKQITLPFSINGLKKGLDYIK